MILSNFYFQACVVGLALIAHCVTAKNTTTYEKQNKRNIGLSDLPGYSTESYSLSGLATGYSGPSYGLSGYGAAASIPTRVSTSN